MSKKKGTSRFRRLNPGNLKSRTMKEARIAARRAGFAVITDQQTEEDRMARDDVDRIRQLQESE